MIKIELYNGNSDFNKASLCNLYWRYFNEVHSEDTIGDFNTITNMIDAFDDLGKTTYVLFDEKQSIFVGFVTMYCNTQYGMTKPVIYVEYMYILPNYRNSIGVALLYSKIGEICMFNNMDCIGSTFTTSANSNNNRLVNGNIIAGVTHFKLQDIESNTKRLLKYINRKGKT